MINIETMNLLKKYLTARIDIKNFGNKSNEVKIRKISDLSAFFSYPGWLEDDKGKGLIIQSDLGVLDLELQCVNDGKLQIRLRGLDCLDVHKHRFPVYIDYFNFEVNNEKILKKNTLTWHDEPYDYEKNVKNSDIIKIHLEWKPFNNYSEFNNPNKKIKNKLTNLENNIKKIPQLSCTSFGYPTSDGKLRYYNWRTAFRQRTIMDDLNGYCDGQWFTRFLNHKFPDEDYKINFIGPFETHHTLNWPMDGKKVFYTGENLNIVFPEMKEKFDKHALDYVDLSMGFDLIDDEKYLRFPFWVWYHFPPDITEEGIENIIDMWNSLNYKKTRDVVNISSHDNWNSRRVISNDIEKIVKITYAGKWRNNTQELWKKYNNNKKEFMNQFKFNLCPENSMANGYVTEKIFDSIISDCIPLYAGGGNYLEPQVLNHNAILRWFVDDNADNKDTIELFRNIYSDEKTYNEFKDQNILLESSKKYIINIFANLEKQFERLIYK